MPHSQGNTNIMNALKTYQLSDTTPHSESGFKWFSFSCTVCAVMQIVYMSSRHFKEKE